MVKGFGSWVVGQVGSLLPWMPLEGGAARVSAAVLRPSPWRSSTKATMSCGGMPYSLSWSLLGERSGSRAADGEYWYGSHVLLRSGAHMEATCCCVVAHAYESDGRHGNKSWRSGCGWPQQRAWRVPACVLPPMCIRSVNCCCCAGSVVVWLLLIASPSPLPPPKVMTGLQSSVDSVGHLLVSS